MRPIFCIKTGRVAACNSENDFFATGAVMKILKTVSLRTEGGSQQPSKCHVADPYHTFPSTSTVKYFKPENMAEVAIEHSQ